MQNLSKRGDSLDFFLITIHPTALYNDQAITTANLQSSCPSILCKIRQKALQNQYLFHIKKREK